MIVNMISQPKKISNGSQPTQPQRSQRFARRNSIHTLHCRQGSLKKYDYASQELFASTPIIENHQTHPNPQKNSHISAQLHIIDQDLPPSFTPSLKRASGSMKIDPSHRGQCLPSHQCETLQKELQIKNRQNEHLQLQCNRYKIYLTEQQQKRKILQQQIRCNRQEIKRLEKRLEKYKIEKDKYEKERETIVKHIEDLQALKFDSKTRELQSFQMQILNNQLSKLREQLRKDTSERQKQLTKQVQKYIQTRYTLQNKLKSSTIANTILSKQLQELQSEMEVLQSSIHKAVTESYQYQELRQKYRIMLVEFKELREEMSILQNQNRSQIINSNILTLSKESIYEQQ